MKESKQREMIETDAGLNELRILMAAIVKETTPDRCYLESSAVPTGAMARITRQFLARTEQDEVTDVDVLATFFAEDVLKLVQELPNQYWFARCFGAVLQTPATHFEKITHAVLLRAMLAISRTTRERINAFDKTNTELTAAVKVAEGVLIISETGQMLVENPVFWSSTGR